MCAKINEDKPILGILLGDATGIGPELVAKVAASGMLESYCRPVIIGDLRILKKGMEIAEVGFPMSVVEDISQVDWKKDSIVVYDQKNLNPDDIKLGEVNEQCGKASGDMLIEAVELFNKGKIDGFSFAPFNKAAMKMGGHNFESEHHLFAKLFETKGPFGEINVLDDLWTSRVTSHIPIKEVSNNLTQESILRAIMLADSTLKRAGIKNARLGIAALNPHAGENGTCGKEEIEVIKPAMDKAKERGIIVEGPYPADILFLKAFEGEFNAAVTMYHDQGQIAMKLKGFEYGITIAAGHPAPIVTCSHGTASDIAGRGIAKTSAFENAIKMTAKIALYNKE